jgi:hypothetical protein
MYHDHPTRCADLPFGSVQVFAHYCPWCQAWKVSFTSMVQDGVSDPSVLFDRSLELGPFDDATDVVVQLVEWWSEMPLLPAALGRRLEFD